MKEKLIELFEDVNAEWVSYLDSCLDEGKEPEQSYYEFQVDHLLANGAIVMPCKVGDTVWFNTWKNGKSIGVKPHKVDKVAAVAQIERKYGDAYTDLYDWEFGKTVFLTREDAEAALREGEG